MSEHDFDEEFLNQYVHHLTSRVHTCIVTGKLWVSFYLWKSTVWVLDENGIIEMVERPPRYYELPPSFNPLDQKLKAGGTYVGDTEIRTLPEWAVSILKQVQSR